MQLTIEVKDADTELLGEIAEAEFRTPEQQAAAFVHAVLAQQRARANGERAPRPVGRRGRTAAAA